MQLEAVESNEEFVETQSGVRCSVLLAGVRHRRIRSGPAAAFRTGPTAGGTDRPVPGLVGRTDPRRLDESDRDRASVALDATAFRSAGTTTRRRRGSAAMGPKREA